MISPSCECKAVSDHRGELTAQNHTLTNHCNRINQCKKKKKQWVKKNRKMLILSEDTSVSGWWCRIKSKISTISSVFIRSRISLQVCLFLRNVCCKCKFYLRVLTLIKEGNAQQMSNLNLWHLRFFQTFSIRNVSKCHHRAEVIST